MVDSVTTQKFDSIPATEAPEELCTMIDGRTRDAVVRAQEDAAVIKQILGSGELNEERWKDCILLAEAILNFSNSLRAITKQVGLCTGAAKHQWEHPRNVDIAASIGHERLNITQHTLVQTLRDLMEAFPPVEPDELDDDPPPTLAEQIATGQFDIHYGKLQIQTLGQLINHVVGIGEAIVANSSQIIGIAQSYVHDSYRFLYALDELCHNIFDVPVTIVIGDGVSATEQLLWDLDATLAGIVIREAIKNMIKHNVPERIEIHVVRRGPQIIFTLIGINAEHVVEPDDIAHYKDSAAKRQLIAEANSGTGASIIAQSGATVELVEGEPKTVVILGALPGLYLEVPEREEA